MHLNCTQALLKLEELRCGSSLMDFVCEALLLEASKGGQEKALQQQAVELQEALHLARGEGGGSG